MTDLEKLKLENARRLVDNEGDCRFIDVCYGCPVETECNWRMYPSEYLVKDAQAYIAAHTAPTTTLATETFNHKNPYGEVLNYGY